ncbi:MAG: DUF1553 domain-containing protein [Planctomycetota bacterium]
MTLLGPAILRRPTVALLALTAVAILGTQPTAREKHETAEGGGAPAVDFASTIRPLLSDRCFQCHGPDASKVASDLRLDQRDDALRDRGGYAAIVPGDPEASELVRRVTSGHDFEQMPPPESKLALDDGEIALLTRWITEGAPYAEHWAFTPATSHSPPDVEAVEWPKDPLDHFVLSKLEAVDLAPAPPADRATLLRRVSYDLTGLPPTVSELDAFLANDTPEAYERAVDRMLESTAHAERMTAEWLDIARYADTFGYQSDVDTNLWPWRDWVLDAFASNLPYDAFLTHQLAGDLLPDATRDTRLATAFNRLHRQTNEGGSVEEEFRIEYVTDRVDTLGAAFLGLTLGCARCHDHKFDPIPQRDYYALSSFFDDIDESGLYSHFTTSVPTPALDLPTAEQEADLAELERKIQALESQLSEAPRAGPRSESPPQGFFEFELPDAGTNSIAGGQPARLVGDPRVVEGARGQALRMSGEDAVEFPGIGDFHRSDPFSIAMRLALPHYERAVVIHRTKSWTDSGSRGYQVLIEDGRLTVALVHFWPGDAIAIRTREPVPVDRWFHAAFTYDGSSRADGLALYLDGVLQDTEVVRDHLTRTIRGGSIGHLTIGSRFRDKGYKNGRIDDVAIFDRELSAAEVSRLEADGPSLAASDLPPSDDAPEADGIEALRALRAERDALRDGIRQIMTMASAPDLPAAQRTAYVLDRGDYGERREAVEPATLSAFPPLGVEHPRTRLDLARWLTHPDHPLTARVHVDRLWRLAFGRGLVDSPEDFGSQSKPPEHLALLDTLARDLIASGWDTRALLRRFVLSATYRQSSVASERARAIDPGNDLLGRAHRGQRPAEMIRDGAMHAAGLLADAFGGPPVFPYQPPGLWQEKSGRTYPVGHGEDLHRRSLYTFWRRTSPPPTMAMFDAPAREVCTVERQATSTPLQTLTLWNDPQFVEVAVELAKRAVATTATDAERVGFLMRALTSHPPSAVQEAALIELLDRQREAFRLDPEGARALVSFDLAGIAHPRDPDAVPSESLATSPLSTEAMAERAATAVVASTLINLDAAITRR